MQKILLGNLVVFVILTNISFKHNEVVMNSKEKIEEVDLISIFPYEY
ncbi:hypothetical protein SAMN04487767_11632 [Bacillus wiedmannii]|uniref:Uncharacterized protein n=1 Tax=Bacillus wiedmannii TaxID=1890302 RepID=A0A1G7AWA8_9BACI|nr:hypothetical protein SAMN04487767_11632 [Bacillus wiedmannii]